MTAKIRKIVTLVEETVLEQGQAVSPPGRRAAAIAVIENPFAGRFQEDLSELIESPAVKRIARCAVCA